MIFVKKITDLEEEYTIKKTLTVFSIRAFYHNI